MLVLVKRMFILQEHYVIFQEAYVLCITVNDTSCHIHITIQNILWMIYAILIDEIKLWG